VEKVCVFLASFSNSSNLVEYLYKEKSLIAEFAICIDASKQFWKYHNEGVLKKYQGKLKVGEVKEEAKL
jgi:hypothetical protein